MKETLLWMALLTWYRMINPVSMSGADVDRRCAYCYSSIPAGDRRECEMWLEQIEESKMNGTVQPEYQDKDEWLLVVRADDTVVLQIPYVMELVTVQGEPWHGLYEYKGGI